VEVTDDARVEDIKREIEKYNGMKAELYHKARKLPNILMVRDLGENVLIEMRYT
jgi:hypothetical protein